MGGFIKFSAPKIGRTKTYVLFSTVSEHSEWSEWSWPFWYKCQGENKSLCRVCQGTFVKGAISSHTRWYKGKLLQELQRFSVPGRYCGFGSRSLQWSKYGKKASCNLLTGRGSCLQFANNPTFVGRNKMKCNF